MTKRQDPANLGKPDSETGLRAKGWNRKKIKELETVFEKLSYYQISKLLHTLEIHFFVTIDTIQKSEILWTIADDWTYEQLKEEINNLSQKIVIPPEQKTLNVR